MADLISDEGESSRISKQLEEQVNARLSIDRFLGADVEDRAGADVGDKRYEIGKLLGQGGMGYVFVARDTNIRRNVALKVLQPVCDASWEQALRFIHEGQITGQLEHPNIVPVHDLGVGSDGTVFYTMKLVSGVTLKEVLSRLEGGDRPAIRKYPLGALLTIFQKTCDAIALAHSRDVVHRDLKPENIMIGEFGEVMVLDWGLAKVVGDEADPNEADPFADTQILGSDGTGAEAMRTAEGVVLGTPAYMAPEQGQGKTREIDRRTDIYSLGSILYNILALDVPVRAPDVRTLIEMKAEGHIDPPITYNPDGRNARLLPHCPSGRIPHALSAVTMKALSPMPSDRYQSVAELQADIESYQGGFATNAEEAGLLRLLLLLLRRRSREIAIAFIALIVLIGLASLVAQQFIERSRRTTQLYRELVMATKERDSVSKRAAPEFISKAERLMSSQQWGEAANAIHVAARLDKEHPDLPIVRARLLIATEEFSDSCGLLERIDSDQVSPGYKDAYLHYLAIAREFSAKATAQGGKLTDELRLELAHRLRKAGDMAAATRICRVLVKDALSRKQRDVALRAALLDLEMMNPTVRRLGHDTKIDGDRFDLDLSTNTELRDISALKDLPLTHLNLEGCQYLSDIAPLEKMPLRYLNLERTRVTRLSELQHMPLEHLVISRTQISSLHSLRELPIRKLIAEWCPKLRIIKDVAAMKQLKRLDLSYSRNVDDIAPLAEVKTLEELRLGRTQVVSIAPLKGLKLKHLDLASTYAADLTPLSGMPLEFLNLEYTAVVDCTPLKKMPIKHLNLRGTDVTDLAPLQELPLTYLDLARCKKLQSVSALRSCTQLETLFVPRQARYIIHMKALPKLKYIGYDSPGLPAGTFWEQYSTP